MKSKFYVIVIDDKKEICQRIEGKITGGTLPGSIDPIIPVTVKTVHITLSQLNNSKNIYDSIWSFSEGVCDSLVEAATEKPDLIIIDYAYVDSVVSAELKLKAIEGEFSEELMTDKALTPNDLRKWIEKFDKISDNNRRKIVNNIFNCSCPVYLHTYTPQGIAPVVGSVSERARKISQVFPNAQLSSVDTRREFFNGDEFDWPNPNSKFDGRYYPYQLSIYFDQVVQKEILRKELEKNKYLRIKRTFFSVAVITAIGASVGFSSGWIGDIISGLIQKKQYSVALIMGIGMLFVIIAAGIFMPFIFEKMMQKIIPNDELTTA